MGNGAIPEDNRAILPLAPGLPACSHGAIASISDLVTKDTAGHLVQQDISPFPLRLLHCVRNSATVAPEPPIFRFFSDACLPACLLDAHRSSSWLDNHPSSRMAASKLVRHDTTTATASCPVSPMPCNPLTVRQWCPCPSSPRHWWILANRPRFGSSLMPPGRPPFSSAASSVLREKRRDGHRRSGQASCAALRHTAQHRICGHGLGRSP